MQNKNITFNLNKILYTISKCIKLNKLSINLPNIAENKIEIFSKKLIKYIYENKISVSKIIVQIQIKYESIFK